MSNLARPVFESESKLWIALEKGGCGIAIMSNIGAAWLGNSRYAGMWSNELPAVHADVEGVGIARHARNPDGALRLVEWLLSEEIQALHSGALAAYPATSDFDGVKNVGVIAWHDEEAAKLAERALYP